MVDAAVPRNNLGYVADARIPRVRIVKKKPKKPKLHTVAMKAWAIQSEIVRLGATDHTGHVNCVTCGDWLNWKQVHAGHFIHISRQHPLSYDDRNVHPQCVRCNYFGAKGMASIEYTMYMIGRYGFEVVEMLKARKIEPYMRRLELESLIESLKGKRKLMLARIRKSLAPHETLETKDEYFEVPF